MAPKRAAPPPPKPASQGDGEMSSTDSSSYHVSLAEVEDAYLQPPSKSADLPVPAAPEVEAHLQPASKSADLPVPDEEEQEADDDADLQPAAKSPSRKRKRASGEIAKSPHPKAPEHQQGGDKEVPKRKSEKLRRIWAPDDEVHILVALADLRRQHGKLPKNLDSLFVDSIAESLQDKGWDRRAIKDKARSLRRRYHKDPVSTTSHEKRLDDLSKQVWEDLPDAPAADGTTTAGTQNGGCQTQDKSFDQMCEQYPRLAKEVKLLAAVEPAIKNSFSILDDKRAHSIEGKLEKVSFTELKIQNEMLTKVEAPKAKIRKKLVNLLMKVSKSVGRR